MVEGGLPGQTGAIFHFRPYPPISGEGKGLSRNTEKSTFLYERIRLWDPGGLQGMCLYMLKTPRIIPLGSGRPELCSVKVRTFFENETDVPLFLCCQTRPTYGLSRAHRAQDELRRPPCGRDIECIRYFLVFAAGLPPLR